jgi:predicted phosphohydrolase
MSQDAEMEALASRITELCAGRHSTVVLGALFSVALPIISFAPDRGYALACADFLETQGRSLKRQITS